MSVPVPDRSPSKAQFLDTAYEIDREVLSLYRKKYYEDMRDTVLRQMYEYSSAMLSCLIRADDIYSVDMKSAAANRVISLPMVQDRFRLFTEAKGHLAALINKATELYIVKPVKHRYRGKKKHMAILLATEYKLLKGMCDSEKERLKKFTKLPSRRASLFIHGCQAIN